ncbi:hypothetical protein C8A00DRAFT_28967 [Chaetomidium leptoderma]|uniref:Uncharacterized protein n=1 Tax=Chaetomidium leptoderma TaxID=669021 RepID=A0AAN6VUS7_9PEZI|nr:hypothetical protein C8A00DRAFT_28967 [Chaetomidium leptoderma]
MADPERSISNGTCVSAFRKKASRNFIPCGNSAFGDIHCCQAGDYCLDDNACFNGKHGTTYLAGCTNFHYEDPSCPDKKSYEDYPWAGLIYCKPNRWMACEETAKPLTITKGDQCTCPPESETMTVAFSAPSVIAAIGILPTASGGTIEWQPGHLPTEESRPTTSSSSASETTDSEYSPSTIASSTNLTLPSPTDTQTNSSPSQNHNLSDGAKAGIGIGSAVGAILLFGALSAFWLVIRRRRNDKNTPSNPETGQAAASGQRHIKSPGDGAGEMPTPEVPPRPVLSELPVGPWVVWPELQGDATPAGYGHASPPGTPHGQGWQGPEHGWGAGMTPSSTLPEDGRAPDQQHQARGGQAHWSAMGERPTQGQGVALELPA